jgi:membrane-associated phospholipid phosphatase
VRSISIILSLLIASTTAGVSQGPIAEVRYRASWVDVAAVTATGVTALIPGLLKLPNGPPSCAPCSPSALPGIDRWVVGANSSLARRGSDVFLIGVSSLAAYAALHDRSPQQARGNLAVLAHSVSWTAASTAWLKVLVHRKRPVLYTSAATAAAPYASNQQSFPSGHTSVAFAIATSYLVMANREHLPHRTRNAILLYGGASSVGVLRLAGGRHFPTDVLGGAVLGAGIGWLVAAVHPKVP